MTVEGTTGPQSPAFTVGSIAQELGGAVERGDVSARVTGIAGLSGVQAGQVSFVADKKHARSTAETKATALLVTEGIDVPEQCRAAVIRVPDMQAALGRMAELFAPPEPPRTEGIHPTASIGRDVVLGDNVSIGPCAVVEDRARIGDGATIDAQAFVGYEAVIGPNTHLFPGVKVCHRCEVGANVVLQPGVVLGGDGFGFAFTDGRHVKVPQIGNVVVEDDVEIGSNTTVDRARFGSTRIGQGTKIDNLVMIAHNVQIGRHCIITGHCGIAGSTTMGNYVLMGARSALIGHITVGDGAKIAASAGVIRDVPPGAEMLGVPAEPRELMGRMMMSLRKLPDLLSTVRGLKKQVSTLCKAIGIDDEETAKND